MSKLNFQTKLILMLLIPLLGLFYFTLDGLITQDKIRHEMEKMQAASQLAVKVRKIMHEIQRERGLTAIHLSTHVEAFAVKMQAQYQQTDQSIFQLKKALTSEKVQVMNPQLSLKTKMILEQLNLTQIRQMANQHQLSSLRVADYYSKINQDFLQLMDVFLTEYPHSRLLNQAHLYVDFLYAIEYMGLERAILGGTFATNQFQPGSFERYLKSKSVQEVILSRFMTVLPEAQAQMYAKKMQQPFASEVDRMEKIASTRASDFGVDSQRWFVSMSEKMGQMEEFEGLLARDLTVLTDQAVQKSWISQLYYSGVLGFNILLLFALGFYVRALAKAESKNRAQAQKEIAAGQQLNEKVNQLLTAIESASKGQRTEISIQGDDPIGKLGRAFSFFLRDKYEKEQISEYFNRVFRSGDLLQEPELNQLLTKITKELSTPISLETNFSLPSHGFFQALSHSPLAIVLTNPQARILYVNPQFEKISGYSKQELLGQSTRLLQSGKTALAVYQDLWKTITSGHFWFGEIMNKRKDGSFYWETSSISPIFDLNGNISYYIAIKQDISQRKLAESNLRYQAILLDSLADAVISTDLEMVILSCNPAAERLYGWSSEEMIGRNWLELQPLFMPQDAMSEQAFEQVIKTGQWSGRVTQYNAQGDKLPVFVTCSVVHNQEQEPSALVLINHDLSQHESLQKALEESEAHFRAIADRLDEGIWSFDPETFQMEYMSESLARMGGFSYRQLLQDPTIWQNCVHPADLESYLNFFAAQKQEQHSGHWSLEYRFITPDNREKWFVSRLTARSNSGDQKHTLWGITEDITLRKQIETERIQSEQFAYGILDALQANICVLDKSGLIVATNGAWKRFASANQGELNYEGWNYLSLCDKVRGVEQETAQAVAAGIRAVLAGDQNTFSIEYPCHSPTEQRWFQCWVNPIAGDTEGRIAVFHQNISIQKNDQQALKRLNGHLEEEVHLRTLLLKQSLEDLSLANKELVLANQMKDSFLANMSHELRTPLTGILGMTDLLVEQILGPLNPKQIKSLQTLRGSGQHLLSLINDILDLSKVSAGKLEIHPEWVSFSDIAQEVLAMVRSMSLQKHIQISLQVEPFDLRLWADVRHLKQILVNLLSNAIKFTPAQGQVTLQTWTEAHWNVLAVRDSGIGIAPEDLDKLFRPFVQIDSGLSRNYSGTGLGLSLVKNLVDSHGGRIEVTSASEKGTCFTLFFPIPPE